MKLIFFPDVYILRSHSNLSQIRLFAIIIVVLYSTFIVGAR